MHLNHSTDVFYERDIRIIVIKIPLKQFPISQRNILIQMLMVFYVNGNGNCAGIFISKRKNMYNERKKVYLQWMTAKYLQKPTYEEIVNNVKVIYSRMSIDLLLLFLTETSRDYFILNCYRVTFISYYECLCIIHNTRF